MARRALFKSTLLCGLLSFAVSCNKSGGTAVSAYQLSGDSLKAVGKWKGGCIQADVSMSFEIIVQILESGRLNQLFKKFDTADCTGPSTFVDPRDGQPATELIHMIDLTEELVQGVPEGFIVFKTLNIHEATDSYIVMYVGDSPATMHVYTEIEDLPGSEWPDWTIAHPGIVDFVNDPTNSELLNTIHFIPTTDP